MLPPWCPPHNTAITFPLAVNIGLPLEPPAAGILWVIDLLYLLPPSLCSKSVIFFMSPEAYDASGLFIFNSPSRVSVGNPADATGVPAFNACSSFDFAMSK